MKVSELVAFRNYLEDMSVKTIQKNADSELLKIRHLILNQAQFDTRHEIEQKRYVVMQAFKEFDSYINDLKQQVNQQIKKDEQELLQFSTDWFVEQSNRYKELATVDKYHYDQYGVKVAGPDGNKMKQKMDHDSQILNRTTHPSVETEEFYKARLIKYSDWRFPGMIIHPGLAPFIADMVASDPLYLLDISTELLRPAMKPFPEIYRQRLRTYVIDELSDSLLGRLPDNQFGVCLVYNFLNYRPLEVIKKYLSELYQKLRPGGTLIMTFNDCDRKPGVQLAEQNCACYTPGKLIIQHAQSAGFEVVLSWNDGGPATWLEIQKPGAMTSLRGGQTIAKIRPNPPHLQPPPRQIITEDTDPESKKRIAAAQRAAAEAERIARENAVAAEVERIARERAEAPQREAERIARELAEAPQREAERIARELAEAAQREAERIAKEQAKAARDAQDIYAVDLAELAKLRKRAIKLKIDTPDRIRYGYTLEKLREILNKK